MKHEGPVFTVKHNICIHIKSSEKLCSAVIVSGEEPH